MLNRVLGISLLVGTVSSSVAAISILVSLLRQYGIEILPKIGFLEFLVQQYNEFKAEYIVPEIRAWAVVIKLTFKEWMADAASSYHFLGFGMATLLFLPGRILRYFGSGLAAVVNII